MKIINKKITISPSVNDAMFDNNKRYLNLLKNIIKL